MRRIVLDSTENITLVGGGAIGAGEIAALLAYAPVLVAADGGADRALAAGHRPAAVIGDMDSIANAETWRKSDIPVHRIAEQDSTDFEKCLYSLRAPLILGCGFLGGRNDHALAALSALVRYAEKPVILLGAEDLVFHCPPELSVDLPADTTVSLFPLAPVTAVRSGGLRWPVAGLAMRPGGRIGTSNRALGGRVDLAFDAPGMLVILPRAALPAAISALSTPER